MAAPGPPGGGLSPSGPPLAVLPAWEEEGRVGRVVRGLRGLGLGALVVLGRPGHLPTRREAEAAGADCLEQAGRGYADAVVSGLQEAARRGSPAALLLDGDGQHGLAAAELLLQDSAADILVGVRRGQRGPRAWGNRLCCLGLGLAGQPCTDAFSGLQRWSARALGRAGDLPRDVLDLNLRIWWRRQGLEVRELPVQVAERAGGRSMHAGLAGPRNLLRSTGAAWREWRAPGP